MSKQLLFSVIKSDCDWDTFRCPGNGGQKVNKTSSGIRCTHRASGAVGKSCDTRSQSQNRHHAFRKMFETAEFKAWHKLEVARRTGMLQDVETRVNELMADCYLKVELLNGVDDHCGK